MSGFDLEKRAEELWLKAWKDCRGAPSQGIAVAAMLQLAREALEAHGVRLRAPEEVDLFRAFSMWTDGLDHRWIDNHARDWFGPLVETLEQYAHGVPGESMASRTLAALRERARAAQEKP